jgi:hypothetical protein
MRTPPKLRFVLTNAIYGPTIYESVKLIGLPRRRRAGGLQASRIVTIRSFQLEARAIKLTSKDCSTKTVIIVSNPKTRNHS